MHSSHHPFRRIGLVAALVASACSLQAVTVNFNFSGNEGDGAPSNTRNFNSSPAGISVAVTGWGWTGTQFIQGSVGQYDGGLGVKSTVGDGHTVDNSGLNDIILFSFSRAVDINTVTFGYVDADADFRYWIGSSGSLATLLGSGGQDVLGNGTAPQTFAINNGGLYNNTFGSYIAIAPGPSGNNDSFKVSGVNVTFNTVPDQGSSLVLLGLGLTGLAAVRKRLRR